MNIALYDCKFAWAESFSAGPELEQALEDDVSYGDAAMTLVEPAVAISALEQWLEDAALDYDPEELPGVRAKVAETIGELKNLGEGNYVALNG